MTAGPQIAQGARQASIRAVTGSAETLEGDWHRLFDLASIAQGPFEGRLLAWINVKLSASYTNLPEAQQALANYAGAYNWSSLGTFDASTNSGPTGPNAFTFTDTTSAALSTSYTSAGVVLAGTGGPWAVTVTGGTASINGGAYSASPGNAAVGDTITARGTSSASVSTAQNVVVSVGTTSDTYSITTVANSEASAFILRMTTDPGATRRGLYDTLYGSLKNGATSSSNILTLLDAFYLTAAHEAATALLNLKSTSFSLTYGGGMSATDFTTDRGFTGDGVAKYLDTSFLDTQTSVNWSQNSAYLGAWINSEAAGTTTAIVGMANTSNQAVITPITSGTARARIHVGANATVAVANRLGWTAGSRTSSTSLTTYRNTTAGTALTTASTSPSAANINIFRNATSTPTFAADRVAAVVIGGGLTSAQHTDLYNALNTFLTAVGGA